MAGIIQPGKPPADPPVFNTFKRKPLRPFYSLREFQMGIVSLLVLGGVATWVIWGGLHPETALFAVQENLLANKGKDTPIYKRPVEPWVEPGREPGSASTASRPSLDPFPQTVNADGWHATAAPQMFDESNLYVKIDGREGFYKSYGFKKLHFLSLAFTEPAGLSIDIEVFDLGSIQNALGAFVAEISNPDAEVTMAGQSLSYTTRNGAFLVQGGYYVRLLGSDDNEAIRKKAISLRDAFLTSLKGEPLPWAYQLFMGGLKVSPSHVQYYAENAFSFGFANDVYSATLPGSETEVFLTRRTDADEATAMADKFAGGFGDYGKRVTNGPANTALFNNEYVNSIEGVRAHGNFVIGVRLAKSADEAGKLLDRLKVELEKSGGGPGK